jgi:tRNA threonylcarbamoyladenosine biosynthesis protein TsaE
MIGVAITRSPDATRALAEAIGNMLRAGDVVVLSGDLGAGKTVFAQGLGRALDVEQDVTSPTFTIMREHRGRVPFVHVDVYRLDRLQELYDVGIDDVLGTDAVTVIEWGDRVTALLPTDRLEVSLDAHPEDDESRIVTIREWGSSWAPRRDALAAVLAAVPPVSA